jgi:ERCC4-type nuclease
MPDFLVSPTEPAAMRALGPISGAPESYGVDVLWDSHHGLAGVQRKEVADLVASLRDGRLARSLARMRRLPFRVVAVEGRLRWLPDGRLATARPGINRQQLRGLLWSVQRAGAWVVHTDHAHDTAATVEQLAAWLDKPSHTALATLPRPPGGPGGGGEPGGRDWAVHLLQAFPGIGPVVAGAIWDHFGRLPLEWSCDAGELAAVPGIGPARARALTGFSRCGAGPGTERCGRCWAPWAARAPARR